MVDDHQRPPQPPTARFKAGWRCRGCCWLVPLDAVQRPRCLTRRSRFHDTSRVGPRSLSRQPRSPRPAIEGQLVRPSNAPRRSTDVTIRTAEATAAPNTPATEIFLLHAKKHLRQRPSTASTPPRNTARSINREIQRLADPWSRRPRVGLADGTHVSVGDQIATRRNRRDLRTDQHEPVRNRHSWNVTGIDRTGGLTASHPERGTVTLPADYVARHVELGWAVTGYGNQGDTVDTGIAILEPGTTRNHAYVGLTRGRHNNTAWIPDPTGTLNPAHQLADIITRQPDHDSALATQAHFHREAGLDPPAVPERSRTEPSNERPTQLGPEERTDPELDERIRNMQARLNRLQRRGPGRWLGR